ncbi:hypothetical protein [Pseudobacteroides cellulosolvens]|uniref:Uncharacterized protein n=1 Tax=Pseudobacteroides cellulosolvens ATCC 35603 = DSM 2933 TaxID=398512 RepID=A0A0L6JUS7_9FIRM|nr:hypothetical protein [Pseudobacteroides cellulosolvens]KNY29611.1 hypothetical protein Bccel_4885 [Pseudobacteroides cellulosolvens ATCC 35603 = DSM 2933]
MSDTKIFEIKKDRYLYGIFNILIGLIYAAVMVFYGINSLNKGDVLWSVIKFATAGILGFFFIYMGIDRIKKISSTRYIKISKEEICIDEEVARREDIKELYIPKYDDYVEIRKINGKKIRILENMLEKDSFAQLKEFLSTYQISR